MSIEQTHIFLPFDMFRLPQKVRKESHSMRKAEILSKQVKTFVKKTSTSVQKTDIVWPFRTKDIMEINAVSQRVFQFHGVPSL